MAEIVDIMYDEKIYIIFGPLDKRVITGSKRIIK